MPKPGREKSVIYEAAKKLRKLKRRHQLSPIDFGGMTPTAAHLVAEKFQKKKKKTGIK